MPLADLQHTFGSDLVVSATGSLALSTGTQLGQDRVLRRLLTNPGAYIWHLAYGAGLPSFIGTVAAPARIEAVARTQMYLEKIVSRTPAPRLKVVSDQSGQTALSIRYVDATAPQQPVVLALPLTG